MIGIVKTMRRIFYNKCHTSQKIQKIFEWFMDGVAPLQAPEQNRSPKDARWGALIDALLRWDDLGLGGEGVHMHGAIVNAGIAVGVDP